MHEQRTATRILAALADAPMNDEALLHELEVTRRSLGQALGHLRRSGCIEQDDRGCWSLVKADAEPAPVIAKGTPPTFDGSHVEVDPGQSTPMRDAIADIARDLAAIRRPPVSISTGDQVLQVLIAAGRITQDDIRLASTLIGSRT